MSKSILEYFWGFKIDAYICKVIRRDGTEPFVLLVTQLGLLYLFIWVCIAAERDNYTLWNVSERDRLCKVIWDSSFHWRGNTFLFWMATRNWREMHWNCVLFLLFLICHLCNGRLATDFLWYFLFRKIFSGTVELSF